MDRLIKRWEPQRDGDLRLVPHRGVAYQKNMKTDPVAYDDRYHDHYRSLEDTPVAHALNAGRCALLARHAQAGARVLDIGAGCGTFVRLSRRAGFQSFGYDIMPKTVALLKSADVYATDPADFDVVTFWDSLEHIECPEILLREVRKGGIVLVAIPLFDDLERIRESKHYKPGEHLYYWTAQGFIDWMGLYGFRLIERSDHETAAGRESIGAFVFRRDLPGYRDYIAAYAEMHSARFYGSSATELHLHAVTKVVRELNPASVLDFGCGRSDLVAHFYKDGQRRIGRYDPAIPAFKRMPDGLFDLALCCDVMEHIPMASVERVLDEIREKSKRVFFSISLKPARARLPDGQNAHVTLLSRDEWLRWLGDVFGSVRLLAASTADEIRCVAGA